eukprot:m.1030567 g.1030567  ORF g.1030567 m.1030567 type:complete len:90 (+) comp24119_c0_seq7:1765-2034(+)
MFSHFGQSQGQCNSLLVVVYVYHVFITTLPPSCVSGAGQGCCHTAAYMEIADRVKVPDVPPGKYVVRWRWDAEQSPQIWSGCGDIVIKA